MISEDILNSNNNSNLDSILYNTMKKEALEAGPAPVVT